MFAIKQIKYGTCMTEKIDINYYWKSKESCQPNECKIRIYWLNEVEVVVITSNVIVSPGKIVASITPEIINFVCDNFDLLPHKMMLVEHYSFGNLSNEEIYFHVLYTNNEVRIYEISPNELTRIIGN